MDKILQKLYTSHKEGLVKDILSVYKEKRIAIVHFLYFANAAKFRLFEEQKKEMDRKYRETLLAGDFLLPDGIALQVYDWLQHKRKRWVPNLNGTDFTPFFLEELQAFSPNIYLYGAKKHVLEKVKEKLNTQGLDVVYMHDGYSDIDASQIGIDPAKLNVMLIGRGTPKQELWVEENREKLHGCIVLTIGGLLDFLAGEEKRAPKWVVKARVLETFWRVITNPGKNLKKFLAMFGIFRILITKKRLKK